MAQETKETVLITGASSGIGKALAHVFAKQKFHCVLTARNESALNELAADLRQQHNITVDIITQDLSLPSAGQSLFNQLNEKQLHVDILINNAGFGKRGKFEDISLNDNMGILAVNVAALVELTYLLLPHMREQRYGKILNVGSIAGFYQGGPFMAMYFASKAFVLSFSLALSEELHGTGITVTDLCPGMTETNFSKNASIEEVHTPKQHIIPKMSADTVAQQGFEALMKGRRTYINGWHNVIITRLIQWMPRSLFYYLTRKYHGK